MNKIAPYMKAIVGAIIAGLTALIPMLEDDRLTRGEVAGIALAFFAALGVVWAVPNKDPEAEHQTESVQPPTERGAIDTGTAIVLSVLVVIVVLVAVGRLG